MLGHLALLGARRPVLPLASGGPPEGRMAAAHSTMLLADWADRCQAAGGLVVAAHFPLPYAEIAADIVAGKIDARRGPGASLRGSTIRRSSSGIASSNLGYRLPIVAGTDKMSAEVPVGAVRTYTRPAARERTVDRRGARVVRAMGGCRSSRPDLHLLRPGARAGASTGASPANVIRLDAPARLQVTARARAAQPTITDLELIVNGRVVASTTAADGASALDLDESIRIERGSWIAARSRSSHEIQSAFTTSMAAHTSPVYVEVADRPLVPTREDAAVVEQVIQGARTWVDAMAAVTAAADRARMVAFLDRSLAALRARLQ